jgi:hypothetical protein
VLRRIMSEMSTGLLYAWVHEYQTDYVNVMVVERERERERNSNM